MGNISLQQDGTTCHTAEATIDVLRAVFEDRIISRGLATSEQRFVTVGLLFVVCGAVKDKCYADKPETVDALKHNIREVISEIHTYIHNWPLQPFSQDY